MALNGWAGKCVEGRQFEELQEAAEKDDGSGDGLVWEGWWW